MKIYAPAADNPSRGIFVGREGGCPSGVWNRGRTEPPAEILVRLAYLFGTSVDILVQKDRLARDTGDVEKQIADLRAQIQECEAQLAENGGDNPVAKAYLQTMKDLLTQMERMSSTPQFADSLAEPLNLSK